MKNKASEVRQSQWNPKRMNSGFSFEMFSLLGLRIKRRKREYKFRSMPGGSTKHFRNTFQWQSFKAFVFHGWLTLKILSVQGAGFKEFLLPTVSGTLN